MAPRNRKLRVKERRYRTRCPATLLLLANRTPNRGTTVNRVGLSYPDNNSASHLARPIVRERTGTLHGAPSPGWFL